MVRLGLLVPVLAGFVVTHSTAQSVMSTAVVGPGGLNAISVSSSLTGPPTTDERHVLAGTVLGSSSTHLVTSLAGCASASLSVSGAPAPASSPSFGFTAHTYSRSFPPMAYCSGHADADVVLHFDVPSSFAGILRATGSVSTYTFGSSFTADIGNDGTNEISEIVTSYVTREVPIAFGAGGIDVRLTFTSGTAPDQRTGDSGVIFELVPRLTVAPFGPTCGHALLGAWSGSPTADAFAFQVVRAPANRLGLLGVGARQLSVPITPTGCLLLVDPIVILPYVTDATGSFTQVIVMPPVPGLHAFVQSAITDPAVGFAGTSNGLELQAL